MFQQPHDMVSFPRDSVVLITGFSSTQMTRTNEQQHLSMVMVIAVKSNIVLSSEHIHIFFTNILQ